MRRCVSAGYLFVAQEGMGCWLHLPSHENNELCLQALAAPAPAADASRVSPRRAGSGAMPAEGSEAAAAAAEGPDEEDASPGEEEGQGASLPLENARLRAELAAYIALEAAREVAGTTSGSRHRASPAQAERGVCPFCLAQRRVATLIAA